MVADWVRAQEAAATIEVEKRNPTKSWALGAADILTGVGALGFAAQPPTFLSLSLGIPLINKVSTHSGEYSVTSSPILP